MNAVEVVNLHKSYGATVAVDDLSFQVPSGTVAGLLGPNGAGKTTAIHCLTTLVRPDRGRATVAGHDVVGEPAAVRARIAVVGQATAVDALLTGTENLVLFGRLLGLGKAAATGRAGELVERLELSEVAGRPAATYSGGLRRRLDLAISLLVPRPVLFLDEPTTGLDPNSRQRLWELIRELRADGRTILLTTQYLEEADRLADRILVIDRGRLRAEGTPEELKSRVGGAVCEIRLADSDGRRRALDALGPLAPLVPAPAGRGAATPAGRGAATPAGRGAATAEGGADTAGTEAEHVVTLPADRPGVLADVVRRLDEAGVEPQDVAVRKPTLDDVFFALTDATSPVAAARGRA